VNGLAEILIALLLLLANGYFVGAEFALISARRSLIEPRAAEGSRAAVMTLGAMERVSQMLAGAQLGVTIASLGLGAVAEPAVSHLIEAPFDAAGLPEHALHPVSFALSLAIVAFLHVVLGEVVPKNISLAGPERAALLLAPPLVLFSRAFAPAIAVLNFIATVCLRAVRVEPKDEVTSAFTRDEVAGLVEESHREGLLDPDEHERLTDALAFDARRAASVLLAPENLVTVPPTVTPREVEALAARTGFTRFPVRDDDGALVGYLHLKDVLETRVDKRSAPVAAKWVRPLVRVGAGESLRAALATMQQSGAHLARVTDADGSVIGLIALEDVLEELVGEIRDEIVTKRMASGS
jgi:CBS domain containing-hemolysin-like protein